MEVIEFKGETYPAFQSKGNAAKFAIPFAKEILRGEGLDIGCNRKEWAYPGALMVDPAINEYDAMNLPLGEWDYIFASHSLEHIKESWTNVLDYWLASIKAGGHLFLYLPHISQLYWNIDSNRKHIHQFGGDEIREYLQTKQVKSLFVSGVDLNNSFYVVCEKTNDIGTIDEIGKRLHKERQPLKRLKSEQSAYLKFNSENAKAGGERIDFDYWLLNIYNK